ADSVPSPPSGGSAPRPTKGRGGAAAPQFPPISKDSPAYTGRWGHPPWGTYREAKRAGLVGLTARAISGWLGDMALLPTTMTPSSTTYGSSFPPPTNGHGWRVSAPSPSM